MNSMNFKTQGIIFFSGVLAFTLGIIIYPDEAISYGERTFNPYLAIGVILFGIGSLRPFIHWK